MKFIKGFSRSLYNHVVYWDLGEMHRLAKHSRVTDTKKTVTNHILFPLFLASTTNYAPIPERTQQVHNLK